MSDKPETEAEAEESLVLTSKEFTAGVRAAAQMVARVHRRRLVLWGFLAGLLSAAVIALPAVFFVGKRNCDSITQLAQAQEEGFTEGIASRRLFLKQSKDRFGLHEQQFQQLIQRSDASQRKQLKAIKDVARTDCTRL